MNDKRAMIDADTQRKTPSIRRQCALLGLNRASWYDGQPAASEPPENLGLMERIDQLYTAYPFYGSRKMTAALAREGDTVNRKRVQRLMRLMGLRSVAPRPNTSQPHPQHKVYPYLLRGLPIGEP